MEKSVLQKDFSQSFNLNVSIVVLILLQWTVSDVMAQVTIAATEGFQRCDISSLGFANADIVKLKSGTDSTAAVVVDGAIEFYARQTASYSIEKESTVTASTKASLSPVTVEEYAGGVNAFGQYKGKGDLVGSAERPLTGLTHFIGIGTTQTGNSSSSWKQANTYAGYSWFGDTVATRGVCYILVEDRNETTGKLLASLYFDPTISVVGHESLRGPHSYNFIFNPTDSLITAALAIHSTYKASATLRASALDSVKAVREADSSMILANVGFKRAYSTTAKTYTFDIVTISGGKFKSGDVLEFKYLLGSADMTVYHGNAATTTHADHYRLVNLEANAQSQVGKDTVDADGYVKFTIYGGGFFSLTKKASIITGLSNTASATDICAYGKSIEVSTEAGSEVSVYNLTGAKVLSGITTADKTTYTLNKAGVYVVKVGNKNGVVTQKCIVR